MADVIISKIPMIMTFVCGLILALFVCCIFLKIMITISKSGQNDEEKDEEKPENSKIEELESRIKKLEDREKLK